MPQHARSAEGSVVPPGAEECVVAAELVVVLVDAFRAVVFDEDRVQLAVLVEQLEDGVGTDQARAGP